MNVFANKVEWVPFHHRKIRAVEVIRAQDYHDLQSCVFVFLTSQEVRISSKSSFFSQSETLNISIKKQETSVCPSLCVCASNIAADQNQTDLRFSTWLLRG